LHESFTPGEFRCCIFVGWVEFNDTHQKHR
jgi:hypothetical protein